MTKDLKKYFWDYNIDFKNLERYLENKSNYDLETELILKRLFERMYWYDLIDLFGIERIKEILTKEFISKIHNKERKQRLEFARRILHKEPIPPTGWNPEAVKRNKNTILSNRWYSTKQTLL